MECLQPVKLSGLKTGSEQGYVHLGWARSTSSKKRLAGGGAKKPFLVGKEVAGNLI